MEKSCNTCFYYDKCRSKRVCNDYIPLCDELDAMDIDSYIETGRQNFYKEWAEYIEKFNV